MGLLNDNLIDIDVRCKGKDDLIKYLSHKADEEGKLYDVNKYIHDVYQREKEYSTAFGYLIAIPHAKSSAVKNSFFTFARLKEPIKWDDNLVQLVFMIGVPDKDANNEHLKILAAISRKLIDESFREELLKAASTDQIRTMLDRVVSESRF